MPMLTTLRMGLPVWPVQRAAAHARREGRHAVEHRMHVRHDVVAVDEDALASGRAQGDVQHRAMLGGVDRGRRGTSRRRVRARPQRVGERQQQRKRLVGDAILRIVEVEAGALRDQALAARGIARETARAGAAAPIVAACAASARHSAARSPACRAESARASDVIASRPARLLVGDARHQLRSTT